MLKRFLIFVAVLFFASQALAAEEICGDGIDNDSSGGDLACPAPDSDRDGFATDGSGLETGTDCDDTNRYIYPGIHRMNGSNVERCESNGTWTDLGTGDLCESVGGGTCYYVDKGSGSNSNNGLSSANAFETLECVVKYDGGGAPACNVTLGCGDVVYIFDGTYNESIPNSRGSVPGLLLEGPNCQEDDQLKIKAYPGETAAIIQEVRFWTPGIENGLFEGVQIAGATGDGFKCEDCNDVEFRNLWVHDADGTEDNNASGMKFNDSTNMNVHHNRINDNYDRSDSGQNNTNVVLFRGYGNVFKHNVIYNASPSLSGGIKYKHGELGGDWEAAYNVLWYCTTGGGTTACIGGGQPNSHIHHNLIVDPGNTAIVFDDFGGANYITGNLAEYNTIIRGQALRADYDTDYGTEGDVTFSNNIIIDDASSYNDGNTLISVSRYGTDPLYATVYTGGLLDFNSNCWYNSSANVQFGLFQAGPPSYGLDGSREAWIGWQAYGFEAGGYEENPGLDAYHIAGSVNCESKGWSQASGTPPPPPTSSGVPLFGTFEGAKYDRWYQ